VLKARGTTLCVTALLAACTFDPNAGGGANAGLGMNEDTGMSGDPSMTQGQQTSDSNSGESSGGDTEPDTSGVPVPCDGGICVAAVPDGWTGPIVVGRWGAGDDPLACPQDWPMAAAANTDFAAAMSTCGCDCAQTVGSCVVSFEYFYGTQCGTSILSGSTGSECADEFTVSQHAGVIASVAATGSACTAVPLATTPAIAWGGSMLACQPAQLGTCDTGVCMPEVPLEFDERYCIMVPGEQDCPAGPYIARSVGYRNATDDRGCSACNCTLASATCNGGLGEFRNGDCTDGTGTVAANGTCQASAIGSENDFSVAYVGDGPQVTCTPTASAAMGTASPADPVTFCCTP
jgi:hypothetical protein